LWHNFAISRTVPVKRGKKRHTNVFPDGFNSSMLIVKELNVIVKQQNDIGVRPHNVP